MNKIPDRFPASASDKSIFSMRGMSEEMIHLEMEFDQPLDVDRLEQALDLILDAEPILGCRFQTGSRKVYWERLSPEERRNFTLTDLRTEYEAFLAQPYQTEQGPQLKACLWREPEKDHLLLKIGHEAGDAGGLKEAVCTLSRIYTQLAVEPDYLPQPNLRRRNIWQVLEHIPKHKIPAIYANFLKNSWDILKSTENFGLPINGTYSGRPLFCLRHLPANKVARLAEFGRKRNATLNDLMLTAYIRAMAYNGEWDGIGRLHSGTTIDFRRHIPGGKAEAVCNLSGVEFVFFNMDRDADFTRTLDMVSTEMIQRKANWIGLSSIFSLPGAWMFPVEWTTSIFNNLLESTHEKQLFNSMTNMGPIQPEHVTFDHPATTAWLIAPPVYPPYCLLGISGYSGSLTLSMASYAPAATHDLLGKLMDNVLDQLDDV